MAIKHGFVSAIPDDPAAQAAGEVLPSHWNSDHVLDTADGQVLFDDGHSISGNAALTFNKTSNLTTFEANTGANSLVKIKNTNTSTNTAGALAIDSGNNGQALVGLYRNGTQIGRIDNESSRFGLVATGDFSFTAGGLQCFLKNDSSRVTFDGNGNTWRLMTSSKYISVSSTGVGINQPTPAAELDVLITSASNKGIVLRPASGQTANTFEVQNSSGTALFYGTSSNIVVCKTGLLMTAGQGAYIYAGGNEKISLAPNHVASIATNPTVSIGQGMSVATGSGIYQVLQITPTYNQIGTAGSADIYINRTHTALGSGTHRFLDLRVGGVETCSIESDGDINVKDEAYGAGWNGSTEVPTKNAVYDKINSMFTGTANITVGTTPPASPAVGDLWVDTN